MASNTESDWEAPFELTSALGAHREASSTLRIGSIRESSISIHCIIVEGCPILANFQQPTPYWPSRTGETGATKIDVYQLVSSGQVQHILPSQGILLLTGNIVNVILRICYRLASG